MNVTEAMSGRELLEESEAARLREIEKAAKAVVQLAIVRKQLPDSFLAAVNSLAMLVDSSRDFAKDPLV